MLRDRPYPDLTPSQTNFLRGLLLGESLSSLASQSNISERTLRSWKQLPAFRAALETEQAVLLEQTRTRLTLGAEVAVDTLIRICRDPGARDGVRVAAAARLLTFFFRHVPEPSLDLNATLETVEAELSFAASAGASTPVAAPNLEPAPETPPAAIPVPDDRPAAVSLHPDPVPAEQECPPFGRRAIGNREASSLTSPWLRSRERIPVTPELDPLFERHTALPPAPPALRRSPSASPYPQDPEPSRAAILLDAACVSG